MTVQFDEESNIVAGNDIRVRPVILACVEAIDGHEAIWDKATHVNYSYLPWNAFNDAGDPVPQPTIIYVPMYEPKEE